MPPAASFFVKKLGKKLLDNGLREGRKCFVSGAAKSYYPQCQAPELSADTIRRRNCQRIPSARMKAKKPRPAKTERDPIRSITVVRVTGLEPVRHSTHAPQTCLSANSSTLAFLTALLSCLTIISHFAANVKGKFLFFVIFCKFTAISVPPPLQTGRSTPEFIYPIL